MNTREEGGEGVGCKRMTDVHTSIEQKSGSRNRKKHRLWFCFVCMDVLEKVLFALATIGFVAGLLVGFVLVVFFFVFVLVKHLDKTIIHSVYELCVCVYVCVCVCLCVSVSVSVCLCVCVCV